MTSTQMGPYAYSIEVIDLAGERAARVVPVHIPVEGMVLVDGQRLPGLLGVGGVHTSGEPGMPLVVTLLAWMDAVTFEPILDDTGHPAPHADGGMRYRVAIDGQDFLSPRGTRPRRRPWHQNSYGFLPCTEVDVFVADLRFRPATADEIADHKRVCEAAEAIVDEAYSAAVGEQVSV